MVTKNAASKVATKKPTKTTTSRQASKQVAKKRPTAKKAPTKAKRTRTSKRATTSMSRSKTTTKATNKNTRSQPASYWAQLMVRPANSLLLKPHDGLLVMQNVARVSGVFFVVCGALYAMYYAQYMYVDPTPAISQSVRTDTQPANVVTSLTDSTVEETDTLVNHTDSVVRRPAAEFYFTPSAPLKDTVKIQIKVPDATNVTVSAFYESYQNNIPLGAARQINTTEWEYEWDTTQHPDGGYRVVADISNPYIGNRTYRSSHFSYLTVRNTPEEETVLTDVETDVSEPVTNTESSLATVEDSVANENEESITDNQEPSPESLTTPTLETEAEMNLEHTLTGTVEIANPDAMRDTVPVKILSTNAQAIEVYIQSLDNQIQARRFLGVASQHSESEWILHYDTTRTPNGRYRLLALVRGTEGSYETSPLSVRIQNEDTLRTTSEQEEKRTELEQEINRIAETKQTEQHTQTETIETSTATTSLHEAYQRAYMMIEEEVERLLLSIDVANAFNSDADIDPLSTRLRSLEQRVIELAGADVDQDKWQTVVTKEFNNSITAQRERMHAARRALPDTVAVDSDKDGISDYDEITVFGTDPFHPDTDRDGVLDSIEIMRGTDPLVPDAAPSVFESPQETGVVRPDLLQVTSIETVQVDNDTSESVATSTTSTSPSTAQAVIRGQAIPHSFVTLYIFSQPTIVTVRTDSDGGWEYRFDKELADGTHTIYAAFTDNAGRVVAKSEPFEFIKQAEAFFAPGSVLTDQPQPNTGSLFSSYIFYMMMSLSVISLGLVLMLIGFHIQYKRRHDSAYGTV